MLSDDQGWNGLSVAMHPSLAASKSEFIQTPNIERLAAQGMRFSWAYAPAPVCSPTRISLQTGKSPAQLHWTKASPPESGRRLVEPQLIKDLMGNETTIAELLKRSGYATAHFGKWHIRGGGPGKHGYDEHDGDTGNENAYQFTDPNPVDIFGMADRAHRFMENNVKQGKPFFLQLSWNALHASENAMKATLAKYEKSLGKDSKQTTIAAITEDLDTGVGRIMASIDALGLAKNTYVIYMSDNGAGGGKRGGLSGGKGSLWEGGIRVPLIIRGPAIQANSWCHQPVVGYDLFPTICELAGVASGEWPKGIEGGSLVSALRNQNGAAIARPTEELVFHFPHYQQNNAPHSAIVSEQWKLFKFYEDNRIALYDLENDIGERNDVSQSNSNIAKQLLTRLETHLKNIDAQMPTKNPETVSDDNSKTKPRKNNDKKKQK